MNTLNLAKYEDVVNGDKLVKDGHIFTVMVRDHDFRQIIVKNFYGDVGVFKQSEFNQGLISIQS